MFNFLKNKNCTYIRDNTKIHKVIYDKADVLYLVANDGKREMFFNMEYVIRALNNAEYLHEIVTGESSK